MYGLEAISHYNGWAMALAGAIIVMTGLSMLSFIISQLPKIIALTERKRRVVKKGVAELEKEDLKSALQTPSLPDLPQLQKDFIALSEPLGEAFELKALYALSHKQQQPHPHLSIRSLREAGILVRAEDDQFTWHAVSSS